MNSLLRLDRFTLLFVVASTIASLAGQWVFQSLGVYEDRTVSTLYLIAFVAVVAGLAFVFWLAKHGVPGSLSPVVEAERRDRYVAVTLATLLASLPLQVAYLALLYRSVGPDVSMDAARLELQSTVFFLPRLFWYSSALIGVGVTLLLVYPVFRRRRQLKFCLLVQTVVLVLYASKALIIFPLIAAALTCRRFGARFARGRTTFWALLVVLALSVLSVFYNNLRSSGELFMSSDFAVDFFATFMPEQRDGSYLMTVVEDHSSGDYLDSHLDLLMTMVTHKTLWFELTGVSIDQVNSHMIAEVKELLGMGQFEHLNPRIGLIGTAWVFGGSKGLFCIVSAFVLITGLLYRIVGTLRDPLDCYFGVFFFLQFIWSYNSDFINHLPFVGYLLYFFVAFRIVARW